MGGTGVAQGSFPGTRETHFLHPARQQAETTPTVSNRPQENAGDIQLRAEKHWREGSLPGPRRACVATARHVCESLLLRLSRTPMFPRVPLKVSWYGNLPLKLYFLFVGPSLLFGCSLFEKNPLVTRAPPPLRAWLAHSTRLI